MPCDERRGRVVLFPLAFPRLASFFEADLKGAPPLVPGFLLLGLFKFHFDLGPYGAPGCLLVASPDLARAGSINGSGMWAVAPWFEIPGDYVLLGGKVSLQALFLDPRANSLGAVLSEAGEATLGF